MKYLKPIVVLILVFVAGITVGSVVTRYVIKRDIRKVILNPELVRLRVARELTRELALNPAQQTQLDQILARLQHEIAKARKERNLRIRPFFVEAQRRINEMLTPQQQEKFERYQAENGIFSFGAAQGQGQNFPRLQKLKKLRDANQSSPPTAPVQTPAAPPPPAQPPAAPQPPPARTE